MESPSEKIKTNVGSKNRGSRNALDEKFFKKRLIDLEMTADEVVRFMRRHDFNAWRQSTLNRVLSGNRKITIEEAFALCFLLNCKMTELFPSLINAFDQETQNHRRDIVQDDVCVEDQH